MQKWEYKVYAYQHILGDDYKYEKILQAYGDEGWELTGVASFDKYYVVLYFKRPLP